METVVLKTRLDQHPRWLTSYTNNLVFKTGRLEIINCYRLGKVKGLISYISIFSDKKIKNRIHIYNPMLRLGKPWIQSEMWCLA